MGTQLVAQALQLGAQWIRGGFQNVREMLSQAVQSIGSVIARGNPILGGIFSIGAALLGRGKGGAQQVEVVNERLPVTFADNLSTLLGVNPIGAIMRGQLLFSGALATPGNQTNVKIDAAPGLGDMVEITVNRQVSNNNHREGRSNGRLR